MKAKNSQQEIRMDLFVGGFVIEKSHRDEADHTEICRRYAESMTN